MPPFQRRLVIAIVGGAIVIALAIGFASRLYPPETPLYVDLSAAPSPSSAVARPQLRIALAPVWSPERTFDLYYRLADHLAAGVDQPFRIVQRKTHGEVVELLRQGGVQVAMLCGGAFLSAKSAGVPLDVIAVPVDDGGPYYESIIVVRDEAPFRELADLEGKAFGFTDPLSLSGNFYPRSVLIQGGKDPEKYFSRTVFTYSHDGSVRAVVDGIVDAAAVRSDVYEREVGTNPMLARSLRVIHRSPPLGVSPIVVPRSLDPALRARIERTLLTMDASPSGRQVLAALGILRFATPPPGLYDRDAAIVESVERRSGQAVR